MTKVDIDELIKFKNKYKNCWVARDIDTGKILDAGKDLKILAKKLKRAANTYLIENILPPDVAYIP